MRAVILTALAFIATSAYAQDAPEADPADVESIDAIMGAVYDVISGPSDEERDWDRFRSLFYPGARLIPTGARPDGVRVANVSTPDEYAERAAAVFRDAPIFQGKGFYEVEATRRVERYGGVAHVWSTYLSLLEPDGEPFARGINSFQLFHDGERWYVVSIFWQQEDEETPVPEPYLPEAG